VVCFDLRSKLTAIAPFKTPKGPLKTVTTDHNFQIFLDSTANATGQDNAAIGYQALFLNNGDPTNNEGSNNSAFGNYALFSNTTGYGNSAFGWGAMPSNNSGSFNTAAGFQALGQAIAADGALPTGNYNTAVATTRFWVPRLESRSTRLIT
jgi:hypothetical protein